MSCSCATSGRGAGGAAGGGTERERLAKRGEGSPGNSRLVGRRPTWQRDALRRLVLNGDLSDDDSRELTEICKGDHGLIEKVEIKPLAKEHVPDREGTVAAVSLIRYFITRV